MDRLQAPPIRTRLDDGPQRSEGGRNAASQTAKEWYFYWDRLGEQSNANTQKLDGLVTFGPHSARPDSTSLPPPPEGAIYFEEDRGSVLYQYQDGEWVYVSGIMWGTLSPDERPADLGPINDIGFEFFSIDTAPADAQRKFVWSGSAWIETTPVVDPTTTKGDLIVRGAQRPPTRLAVGTNGQVVTADSTQALGIKWTTPATQTPWLSNINGGGFQLTNVGNMAIGGLSTAIGTLSIGCLDTTSLPALSLRSQFAPAYGFDWDIESTSIGRLDLYRVNAGTRTLVMSVLRQQTRVGINKVNPGSTFAVGGLPTFASNAAATGGGLTAGDFYTDGAGNVKVVF